jgi:hypothetical protein
VRKAKKTKTKNTATKAMGKAMATYDIAPINVHCNYGSEIVFFSLRD